MRFRTLLAGGAAAAVALVPIAALTARQVRREATLALARAGLVHGFAAREVRFSWLGPLRIEGLASTRTRGVAIDVVEVGWGFAGGTAPRAHVRRLTARGVRLEHAGLVVEWPEVDLDVLAWERDDAGERLLLRQRGGAGTIDLAWPSPQVLEQPATLSLAQVDLSKARVGWAGEPVLDPGRWTGRVTLLRAVDRLETEGALAGEVVRLALPSGLGLGNGGYGAPTPLSVDWNVRKDGASIEVRRAAARLHGLDVDGHGRFEPGAPDARIAVELSARSDIGVAFRTTGLALPASLSRVPPDGLGTATFDVAVTGPLAEPTSLRIVPRLRFDPEPAGVEALQFLNRPFRHTPEDAPGTVIDVREGAPDFLPYEAVPPLVVRAVIISEDAGFFGHPGIDVAEIPVAWATNRDRGTAARGASTITQQLAKNLFLSQDKTYARKVTEAALALVLDAAVPKRRQLEIYLNVIEWGPGIHGLLPAARHYFGKAPAELTPKEVAFLVCLIPSPVRYHQAHTAGRLGPGMEDLTADLLAKLRSVDAISEDEYLRARDEVVAFRPEEGLP